MALHIEGLTEDERGLLTVHAACHRRPCEIDAAGSSGHKYAQCLVHSSQCGNSGQIVVAVKEAGVLVGMAFINDDVFQVGHEAREAAVDRQDAEVQHVWVGDEQLHTLSDLASVSLQVHEQPLQFPSKLGAKTGNLQVGI